MMKLEAASLTDIYSPIEPCLSRAEKRILSILETPNELSAEVIRYFFKVKGKLLRPALCLFGASLGSSGVPGPAIEAAAAFEIFHSATLIHDDIIDSSSLRRNVPTVHVVWNPQIAVLMGDYLHDKATRTVFDLHNDRVASLFLDTAGEVCDGEILELSEKQNVGLSENRYLEIVGKKTASLLACCLETGAVLAGASDEEIGMLRRFGVYFGTAFQIVDDCLDFNGREREFGKTLGADCTAGILTLPLIRFLEVAGPEKKHEMVRMIKEGILPARFPDMVRDLEACGALDYAFEKAGEFSDRARQEITRLRSEPLKKSLGLLLDYVLERYR